MTIGERIKDLRKKNDLTQEKLADYLCVSYQAVSKWECGASNPDLSLIVPLAKLFHITTDELLGMDKNPADNKKAEYDALYEKAHQPEQLEIAQRATLDYPGEMKYISWQADCMYLIAYDNFKDQSSFYDDLEKVLKLYLIVLENTDDTKLKNGSIAGIVMTLSALKRYNEAERYADMYPDPPTPTKDTVMGWALTGERKKRHWQEKLRHHFSEMLSIMSDKSCESDPNLKELSHLLCAEEIINKMFPYGDYNCFYDDLMLISIYKAQIYQYSEPEKAIESLRDAQRYAMEFDKLFMQAPSSHPYSSPYFDMLEFNSKDLLVYGPLEENMRIDSFKWWLSGKCFDPLRNREDFRELTQS